MPRPRRKLVTIYDGRTYVTCEVNACRMDKAKLLHVLMRGERREAEWNNDTSRWECLNKKEEANGNVENFTVRQEADNNPRGSKDDSAESELLGAISGSRSW